MKFFLLAVLFLTLASVNADAQSCVTPEEVKQLLARIEAPPPAKPDKKLKEELLKMVAKQRELLMEVVDKDQAKDSDREKLHKLYEANTTRLCQILKTSGWPTTALVESDGVFAAFMILKNAATYEVQRDLLPVIVAVVKKNPSQRPEFAGLYDRLRVSAGMKQLFGTQAVTMSGFLVLYPIEDEANLDSRREEFGLPKIDVYIRALERTYGKALIKARQPPTTKLSKQLTDSVTKAIDSVQLEANEVDPGDVIKTETNLVSLNVSVFNNKLKTFVGSLTKDDFRVTENGQEQTVTYFASTDVPFDLVLLIDLSGSTLEKRDLIRKSTLRFIQAARPTDRVAIVTFSDTPSVVSPLTLDRTQLAASIGKMDGFGSSRVWDAVKFALNEVIGAPTVGRRRAVVLMSDGLDNSLMRFSDSGSGTTFADLLELVRQNDTLIVPIYLDTGGGPYMKEALENAYRTLNLLAQESGGSFYTARKLSDLNGVYEQVINDLGKVYSLGYKPATATTEPTWRWIQVSILNRPDLVARTRPGYYAQ